ncbi:MAG: diguanylate cyclase, partial [Eubacteriales bacterium]|nr:diguanylate cyclase [Eubacteriales bacterium]
ENDRILEKFFYDFDKEEIASFPEGFLSDFDTMLQFSKSAEDTSGILQIGREYYFVASSEVTTTLKESPPNGRMLIGRQIDQETIEKNLGCTVDSIVTIKDNQYRSVSLRDFSYNDNKDSILLSFFISNTLDHQSSVVITLIKTRDLYTYGMKNVLTFSVANTLVFLIITAFVFMLLNINLSNPFIKLVDDIMTIDLNEEEFRKLPEEGKHEFLSLRQAVNKMLARINVEQSKAKYLSYHDQLTDLFNRRYFEENLSRMDTPENLPLSILYADVNGLKFINDVFGHQSGDQMIQSFANVLKETCGEGIVARIGGDEFVVLLPKCDFESVEKLASLIEEKVYQIEVNNLSLSVSMGWDTKEEAEVPAIITIKSAEASMYKKKLLSVNSRSNVVIQTILNTLLLKNPREKSHSQRVGMFCKLIGQAFRLQNDQIKELETAGELHDIGKIIMDEAILNKSGSLTELEWAEVRKHPETGYRLLGNANEFYKISEFVLDHHERWDGTGYPKGLRGEEIHWEARVISIADAYDAMTSERTYRKVFSEREAVEEIKKNSGIQFDPAIVKVFVEEVLGYQE